MKGLIFKDSESDEFEIVSEPVSARNQDGYDDVCVAVRRVKDGWINVIPVIDIRTAKPISEDEYELFDGTLAALDSLNIRG